LVYRAPTRINVSRNRVFLRYQSSGSGMKELFESMMGPSKDTNANQQEGAENLPEIPNIPGVAGEFATSFFQQAFQKGGDRVVKAFEVELNVLTWSVKGDEEWSAKTTSPFFEQEERDKTVRAKCEQLGLSPFFTNRVLSLLKNDIDITRLDQIRTDYEEIMRAYRKERTVVVHTAPNLSQEELI